MFLYLEGRRSRRDFLFLIYEVMGEKFDRGIYFFFRDCGFDFFLFFLVEKSFVMLICVNLFIDFGY